MSVAVSKSSAVRETQHSLQLTGAGAAAYTCRRHHSPLTGRFTVARRTRTKPEVLGILGVGLDNKDEHKRVTRSEEMLLVGGSHETHEKMQDVAVRFSQSLKKRGKTLREALPDEVVDLL